MTSRRSAGRRVGDERGVRALDVPAGGAGPAGRAIPALFFAVRFADPRGCFVAVREQDPGRVAGALISVARGTLGWFGPLAVHPHAQRSGRREADSRTHHQLAAAWRPPDGAGDSSARDLVREAGAPRCPCCSAPRAGRQGAPGLSRTASRSPPTSGSAGAPRPRGSAVGPLKFSRPSTAPAAAGFAWRLWPGRALSSRGRYVPVLGAAVTAAWGRGCRRAAGNCGARRWWRPRWSSARP